MSTNSGFEKLLAALQGPPPTAGHAECRAALPEYMEAERAQQPLPQHLAWMRVHLDVCEECGLLYAELLDAERLETAAQWHEPENLPLVRLPRELQMRQIARKITAATLTRLKKGSQDLEGVAQAFFENLAAGMDLRTTPNMAQAFGLGELEKETLLVLKVVYLTLDELVHQWHSQWVPLSEPERAVLVETVARAQAKQHGLSSSATRAVLQTLAQWDTITFQMLMAEAGGA